MVILNINFSSQNHYLPSEPIQAAIHESSLKVSNKWTAVVSPTIKSHWLFNQQKERGQLPLSVTKHIKQVSLIEIGHVI